MDPKALTKLIHSTAELHEGPAKEVLSDDRFSRQVADGKSPREAQTAIQTEDRVKGDPKLTEGLSKLGLEPADLTRAATAGTCATSTANETAAGMSTSTSIDSTASRGSRATSSGTCSRSISPNRSRASSSAGTSSPAGWYSVPDASAIATWAWDIPADRVTADRNLAALFGVTPAEAVSDAIALDLEGGRGSLLRQLLHHVGALD